ncbi:hypothetical protein [Legionella brunensis]|uniref:Uncharacterized protein n=1 Tax=Legionella brunensis TaxID=29422 RepID=A0A0W0SNH5_9GAMM|nr:hypothetical protein [Legionella brunensis]KTC84862.1 hypothetical protein Lbru_1077 [Legionella brunensis]
MLQNNRNILFSKKKETLNEFPVWKEIGEDNLIYKKEMKSLDSDLQDLVSNNVIDLELAKQVHELCALEKDNQRAEKLKNLHPDLWPAEYRVQEHLCSKFGMVLFLGGFLSKDNLEKIHQAHFRQLKNTCLEDYGKALFYPGAFIHVRILSLLCTASGVKALKKGNCKINELIELEGWQVKCLNCTEGLNALEKGLLTTELALKFESPKKFKELYKELECSTETTTLGL